ncbi:hypothetical protein [Burkholderia seminalis]|uniref:hypothetical protein n=1 Tax=Burkholderia seminalis TaxID=488731 RepID=UPI000F5A0CAB|nr:hypothetical protein [Burkholderia seminalis]RQS85137.1 hypothetical protein DF032_01760 [Burkholderia seminalis]
MTTDKSRADVLTDEQREAIGKAAEVLTILTGHDAYPNLRHRFGNDWWEPINMIADALRAILAAPPVEQPAAAPIPMLLFCPRCGTQHVDAPETEPGRLISSGPNAGRAVAPKVTWDNPPHRSHLCHACGIVWRPADVATVGVESIETRGKADTWTESTPWIGHNRPAAPAPADERACGCIGKCQDQIGCPDKASKPAFSVAQTCALKHAISSLTADGLETSARELEALLAHVSANETGAEGANRD